MLTGTADFRGVDKAHSNRGGLKEDDPDHNDRIVYLLQRKPTKVCGGWCS